MSPQRDQRARQGGRAPQRATASRKEAQVPQGDEGGEAGFLRGDGGRPDPSGERRREGRVTQGATAGRGKAGSLRGMDGGGGREPVAGP